jgi:glycosyltransferase involved in cell wall biosynthesis
MKTISAESMQIDSACLVERPGLSSAVAGQPVASSTRGVSLLSNVPHYHHLAETLHKAGALDCYVTVLSQIDENSWRRAPVSVRRKLQGRRLRIPRSKVKQLVLPEAFQKIPTWLGMYSSERGCYINNYLFDFIASRSVPESGVIHFVNSIGLITAKHARKWDATLICDCRQEHPLFQEDVLKDEAKRFGVESSALSGLSYRGKVLGEFEIADHIIVPSTYAKRTFLARGFRNEKVHVLHYGVESELFYPVQKDDDIFRIIYVGRITFRKGIQYLLEAFATLNLPGSELLLVGGIDPRFRPILARFEGSFTHIPQLSHVDLLKQYGRSSFFAMPSLADSFGLVVLEAMACGLPVLISQNTGAADLIRQGVHGFIVPIRDVETIKNAIIAAYESPELLATLSANAAKLARAQSWERYGQDAIALYKNLELL